MMKEETSMLQKTQLLPSPPLKIAAASTTAPPLWQNSRKSNVTVSDNQSQNQKQRVYGDEKLLEPQNSDTHQMQKEENESKGSKEESQAMSSSFNGGSKGEESGRERLKRHRVEVAGQVWIPDIWGQENFLQDWINCSFDSALVPNEIMSARASLVEEGRRAHSGRVGVRVAADE